MKAILTLLRLSFTEGRAHQHHPCRHPNTIWLIETSLLARHQQTSTGCQPSRLYSGSHHLREGVIEEALAVSTFVPRQAPRCRSGVRKSKGRIPCFSLLPALSMVAKQVSLSFVFPRTMVIAFAIKYTGKDGWQRSRCFSAPSLSSRRQSSI